MHGRIDPFRPCPYRFDAPRKDPIVKVGPLGDYEPAPLGSIPFHRYHWNAWETTGDYASQAHRHSPVQRWARELTALPLR